MVTLDTETTFNILNYNRSVIEMFYKNDSVNITNSEIHSHLFKLRIKPVTHNGTLNTSSILNVIPFSEFINCAMDSSQGLHGFLDLDDDRIIELRTMKGVYNDQSVIFLTFVDCSLAKRLESAKVESKNKTLTMSAISHELRTPVTAILGCLESIEKIIPPEGQVHTELAKNSCHMLCYQINDLTDYGKVADSKLVLDKCKVDLNEIIDECISFVEFQAKKNKLILEHLKMETSPKNVWANPRRLKQVLLNLLTNAIKFTTCGRVQVITETVNSEILITVKDTGVGIKEIGRASCRERVSSPV